MTPKIGFACKWIDRPDQTDSVSVKDDAYKYNTNSTTILWLSKQPKPKAEQRLLELMTYNVAATERLIERVGSLDPHLRMLRISSDLLPAYTHPDWMPFWTSRDVQDQAETLFSKVGHLARQLGVRLSMHPGQFVVLASDNPNIVNRSLDEFEYHASMVRWMGYGKTFQDFKINVHISGKQGPDGIRRAYGRMSPEARNCLTIENEENSWGLDDSLQLMDLVPTVMDVHHHWCREGEYLSVRDERIDKVLDSWRGVRPTMHYSVSREDYLTDQDPYVMPEMPNLLAAGYKKQKLRAHSDFFWNHETNAWVLQFLEKFDIMCEAKAKNLASFALADLWKRSTFYDGVKNDIDGTN